MVHPFLYSCVTLSMLQPLVDPQSHLANMRTKPDYEYEISGKTLDGRLYWLSVPVVIVVDDIDKHAGAIEQYKRLDDRTNYEKPATRPLTIFDTNEERSNSSTSSPLLIFLYVLLTVVTLVLLSLISFIVRRTRRIRRAARKGNDGIGRTDDMNVGVPPPPVAQNSNYNNSDGPFDVVDFN